MHIAMFLLMNMFTCCIPLSYALISVAYFLFFFPSNPKCLLQYHMHGMNLIPKICLFISFCGTLLFWPGKSFLYFFLCTIPLVFSYATSSSRVSQNTLWSWWLKINHGLLLLCIVYFTAIWWTWVQFNPIREMYNHWLPIMEIMGWSD